jgi:hypothetical protein
MTGPRTTALLLAFAAPLALVGCEGIAPTDSTPDSDASTAGSPSAAPGTTGIDLSAIGCATNDPEDVGELTGAWLGSDTGVYYIRQVGDCVWWFGTELDDIESGRLGQPGFANVASGRVDGRFVVVEWADLPAGDVLGGGGLSLIYDEVNDRLRVTDQRGDWQPFGGSVLTRIDPAALPSATASASPTP